MRIECIIVFLKIKKNRYENILLIFSIYNFLHTFISRKNYRKFIVNSGTEQKKGIALVVANNNYEYTTNLKYALQDGKIFGAALQEMNYDVQYGFNLNKSSMLETLQSFASKLNEYQNAIIYYSGHGLQFNGRNFIAPSDAKGTNEFELKNTSIDAGDFLQVLEQFQIPKAIILDACRENPFLKDLTSETRSVKGLGLAEIKATKNSIIVYSTAPNTVVPDDNQFTEIFAENIKTGGCIDDVLRKVRIKVQEHDENQLIFSREALLDNICFGEIDQPSFDDIDGDGISNQYDRCPDEYGDISNYGCPNNFKKQVNVNSLFSKEGLMGISNSHGSEIIKPEYYYLSSFSKSNVARAYNNGVWSYINNKGETITDKKYDELRTFRHNRGIAYKNGKVFLLDSLGQEINIEISNYKDLKLDPTEPLIWVTVTNNLVGLIDLNGKTIIGPVYESVEPFSENLAVGRRNSKNVYFNNKGEIIHSNDYEYSGGYLRGIAKIKNLGKNGVIDKNGRLLKLYDDDFTNFNGYLVFKKLYKERLNMKYNGVCEVGTEYIISYIDRNGTKNKIIIDGSLKHNNYEPIYFNGDKLLLRYESKYNNNTYIALLEEKKSASTDCNSYKKYSISKHYNESYFTLLPDKDLFFIGKENSQDTIGEFYSLKNGELIYTIKFDWSNFNKLKPKSYGWENTKLINYNNEYIILPYYGVGINNDLERRDYPPNVYIALYYYPGVILDAYFRPLKVCQSSKSSFTANKYLPYEVFNNIEAFKLDIHKIDEENYIIKKFPNGKYNFNFKETGVFSEPSKFLELKKINTYSVPFYYNYFKDKFVFISGNKNYNSHDTIFGYNKERFLFETYRGKFKNFKYQTKEKCFNLVGYDYKYNKKVKKIIRRGESFPLPICNKN